VAGTSTARTRSQDCAAPAAQVVHAHLAEAGAEPLHLVVSSRARGAAYATNTSPLSCLSSTLRSGSSASRRRCSTECPRGVSSRGTP
jgi:hypothetical protein